MAKTISLQNFEFGNATHVGRIRKVNEDYFGNFETRNGYIFLVCDGMGGHVGGAKAAQLAVDSIRDSLQQTDYHSFYDALNQSFIEANNAILNFAEKNPELTGMGTTCVAILVVGSVVYFAHVGDSRIYLFSKNKLTRITKDHSFVQNLIDLGGLTEDEAEKHPRKNEITNALGLVNMKPPTICNAPIKAEVGDVFLLCSDGLTGMVKDNEIETILKSSLQLQLKANTLVDMANNAGGTDNITVQMVEITNSPYSSAQKLPLINKNRKKRIIPIIVIFLIAINLFFFRSKFVSEDNNFPPYHENEHPLQIDNNIIRNNPNLNSKIEHSTQIITDDNNNQTNKDRESVNKKNQNTLNEKPVEESRSAIPNKESEKISPEKHTIESIIKNPLINPDKKPDENKTQSEKKDVDSNEKQTSNDSNTEIIKDNSQNNQKIESKQEPISL